MPLEFMTLKGLYSVMMLSFTKIQKTKNIQSSEFTEMAAYADEIQPVFNLIFRTNS